MLLGTFALAESPEITESEREELMRSWQSVTFGLYIDMSDYATTGPMVQLQRLNSKQAVLSVIPEGADGPYPMPLAVALIEEPDATHLIEKAMEFYAVARQETPPPRSIERDRIRIVLSFATTEYRTSGRSTVYQANFDRRELTITQFEQFVQDVVKRPSN
jgi:hypothetical protein